MPVSEVVAGQWVPDLVTAAGGQPVAVRAGQRSVQTTGDEFVAARPELLLVAPCGFHLGGAADQARAVAARLPRVPVWAIDGDALVVRPGPWLVDGVETIATILHRPCAARRHRPRPSASGKAAGGP